MKFDLTKPYTPVCRALQSIFSYLV